MTTPFSRSIRVLDADKFRPSLWVIGLTVVILLGWIAWFFLSRVTVLETSTRIQLSADGIIQVEYPTDDARRIRPGQYGWLKLDEAQIGHLPIIVRRRLPANNGPLTTVEVFVLEEAFYRLPIDPDDTGQIQIEVERVSPATLLLRATGQTGNAPRVSVNPQR